jgi:hypothetical protein
MSQFRDKRACTKCGYVRRVVINVWKDGKGVEAEHWNKLCTICELLNRAWLHRRSAADFEERAMRMRLRRNTLASKKGAA